MTPVLVHHMHVHEVRSMRKEKGTCPVCHRPAVRQRTFLATITLDLPVDEAEDEVTKAWVRWVPDFTHEACRPLSVEKVAR